MNRTISTIKVLILSGILLTATSCEDMMSTDSNRFMEQDDNLINSPNDTVFSVLGILSKVQKIADKYVLMGELRADLLEVTNKTAYDLRNLSNHNIDVATSEFSDTRDFYAIINNCNYYINRVDTNITVRVDKPFVRELLAVRTIRAWTYLQLGLNYGKVRYFNKPVLSVDDLNSNYTELETDQLIDTLIADIQGLNPLTNNVLPTYTENFLFINPLFLMGDLYLWKASRSQLQSDFENAAFYYSKLIEKGYLISPSYSIKWYNDRYEVRLDSWSGLFLNNSNTGEMISIIQTAEADHSGIADQPLTVSKLFTMSKNQEITTSQAYKTLSDEQVYCFREGAGPIKYTTGDLRMYGLTDNLYSVNNNNNEPVEVISKYENRSTWIYRSALLYLRYAEAVNRAGKPSLAFAVLKYGLNATNMANPTRISPFELADAKPYVTIFSNEKFNENVGIHSRGSGNSEVNVSFVIPDYTRFVTLKDISGNDSIVVSTDPADLALAKSDSILFVENSISDELALETGLEGNRFHDLMRISRHRNDPAYLAKKVAAKHADNYNHYLNLLSDPQKWYLPTR